MFIHCRSAAQHLPHHHCIARGDPLKYLSLSLQAKQMTLTAQIKIIGEF